MTLKYFTLLLLSISILSFKSLDAQQISKIDNLNENSFIYFLPETGITIEIQYIRIKQIKGRYSDYAHKYLGHPPVVNKDLSQFEIYNAKVSTFNQANLQEAFVITPTKEELKFDAIEKLKNQGVIFLNNYTDLVQSQKNNIILSNIPENTIPYESIYKDRIDTVYKKEFRDSVWVKIPYYERNFILKTEEDHAREAAEILISLNYRLIKSTERLIPEDEYPTNVSEALIKDTRKLINQYSKLFNGYTTIDTFSYETIIFPTKGEEKYNICYFSNTEGVLNNKRNASEISLTLKPININENLLILESKPIKFNNNLFYKVPGRTEFIISNEDFSLAKGIIHIYQFGINLQLPSGITIKK